MSALPNPSIKMTESEYLEFERQSEIHHEFVNGDVFAMAGASWNHSIIVSNLTASLNGQLMESPCIVVATDMRLHVDSAKSYRYPDVLVVCDPPQFRDDRSDIITNPTVLIEVLSPSTALTDYNQKLREYRQIESAHEYLLVSQDTMRIERYIRHDDEEWMYTDVVGIQSAIELPSIHCVLRLEDVYRKVVFDTKD